MLALERKRQGLEVDDLCARLRLSLAQVQALEGDDYAKLPGPTFTRGIIRSYAKILQVDAQPLLDAYEQAKPAGAQLAIAAPTHNIRFAPGSDGEPLMRVVLIVLAVIVVAGGAWLWYTNPHLLVIGSGSRESSKPAGSVAAPAAPGPGQASSASDVPSSVARGIGADTPTGALDVIGAPEATSAAVSPQVAEAAAAPQTAAPGGQEHVLSFAFDRESWVEVRDSSGKVLLSQLNTGGTVKEVSGRPPFKLVIGNAAGVHLTYKGQPIDLGPSTKVNVARLTLE
jgi:cytoskeleton protein RodZ